MGRKTDMVLGVVFLFLMVVGFYALVHGTVWAVRKLTTPPTYTKACQIVEIEGTNLVLNCVGEVEE